MRFVNEPETDQTLPLPMLRARPNQPLDCICATQSYVGLNTHYLGGRTIDCSGEPECLGCCANMLPRWQGYIIVQSVKDKRHAVLQFTPFVAGVLSQTNWAGSGLLGTVIRLTRLGPRVNSPLECKVTGFSEDVKEYSVYRLTQLIEQLFGIRSFDGGKKTS